MINDEASVKEVQSRFSSMNDMQKKAVFHTEGPLLILAGAGSGKTTVLVNRIAYILSLQMCRPWEILAITFTNKAASELKNRIAAVVDEGADDVWAATFHSTCARILRQYGDRLGYSNHFTVYDSDDQKRLMKSVLKDLNIDEKYLPVRTVLSEISKYKDRMKTPKDMMKKGDYDYRFQSIGRAFDLYQKRLLDNDAMDFDDLLCNAVKLFRQNGDILEKYQRRFRYIMVDEYQDTNNVQFMFVSMLAGMYNNICVVGDDDQSIYKFRGATIENILNFENAFKGAKVIRLEQNYRSTKMILDAANAVISNNTERKGKTLWTDNATGEKVTVFETDDETSEGEYIAKTIVDGVNGGRKYSDYAVLYRANAQSNSIETSLVRNNIPHRIIGGHRFYDREEIRDMMSYLHVINNPNDNLRVSRIINKPKRGIGETSVNKALEIAEGLGESLFYVIENAGDFPTLSRAASKMQSFAALIRKFQDAYSDVEFPLADLYEMIIEETGYENYLMLEKENYESRIENIRELESNIRKFEEENEDGLLSDFLEETVLITDIDNYDSESDTVVLMTLHSSKGLEFPIVFIPGMEENVFPSFMTLMNPEEMNEERRLAYVGITRAKEEIHLICAKNRMLYGNRQSNHTSRFVEEIPKELIDRKSDRKEYGFDRVNGYQRENRGFASRSFDPFSNRKKSSFSAPAKKNSVKYSVGMMVEHKKFGSGMITNVEPMGNDCLLEIAFNDSGTRTLMANYANLKVL